MKKAKKDIYIYMYHYVNPCNFLFEELSGIRVRILLRAVDCLDEVLKVYESGEIAKYFALIEIMNKKGKDFSNSLKIRNCLLLLINLCFEIKNPDYLFNKGKLKDDLSEHEKSQFFEILKCEFNIQ